MQKRNIDKIFENFLQKYAPKTHWNKLIWLTRYNGKPIQEDAKVEPNGLYRNGITITKFDTGYIFLSRTIENGEEKINSKADFNKFNKFIRGGVHIFGVGFSEDTNGEYHYETLKEILDDKELKVIWDKIE